MVLGWSLSFGFFRRRGFDVILFGQLDGAFGPGQPRHAPIDPGPRHDMALTHSYQP